MANSDKNKLDAHDPYNNMRTAGDDIKPDFLTPAKNNLRSAEKSAISEKPAKKSDDKSSTESARENEENPKSSKKSGFYSGKDRKTDSSSDSEKGNRFSGFLDKKNLTAKLKKGGPALAIVGIIASIGALMSGAQSLMPIAIEEMIIEKFNSIGVSSTMSSDSWLDTQLNQGVNLESRKTGDTEKVFAFSSYQIEQFKAQNIYAINTSDSPSITVLLYQKGNQFIPIVGSNYLKNGSANLKNSIAEGAKNAGYNLDIGRIGEPISAAKALQDEDFKFPYTTASKSWRGGSSGWFDKIMSNITETRLSINRNRWANFVAGTTKDIAATFKEIAENAKVSQSTKVDVQQSDEQYEYTVKYEDPDSHDVSYETYSDDSVRHIGDESGNIKVGDSHRGGEVVEVQNKNDTGTYVLGDTGEEVTTNINEPDFTTKSSDDQIKKVLESRVMSAVAKFRDVTNSVCVAIEGAMTIYTMVSAFQSMQFLNLISGYLEAVDKVKAGSSDSSPIHQYSTNLTTEGPVKNNEGEIISGKERTNAMMSAGMSWLFSRDFKVNPQDPSVQNTNFESIMSNLSIITSNVKNTAEAYKICGYAKIGTATFDLAFSVLSFIPLAGQGIKLAQISIKSIEKIVVKGLVVATLYALIPIATKKIAQLITKNAATEWFGEDLGNAIVSGANKYLGGNGTSGGQSPGSKAKLAAYLNAQNSVIADEAKYQRAMRSPLDITSPYTFLGSLAYSIIPLAYSNSSIASMITNSSSLLSSSIIAFSPTANAIDADSAMNSIGDCPLLESMGITGRDAACNPYIITDTSTINLSPTAINDIVHHSNDRELASIDITAGIKKSDNFDSDGNIKKDSNLAKYITYCGQRTSQYGLKDAAIAEQLAKGNTVTSLVNYVPVLGQGVELFKAIENVDNYQWITGEACIATEESDKWENEYKYYQRYAENERLIESIDPNYKSTVTAYMEQYYNENPLDQSFEGVLARFSGLDKETVTDTIALIEYYNYLNEYEPETRYSFIKKENKKTIHFENTKSLAFFNILSPKYLKIFYSPIRHQTITA